jgi:two-component sensor histidine kinase
MQVIISLLSLRQRLFQNEEFKQLTIDIKNKIHSMSLVHQKLYQSKDLSRIDLGDYIRDLTRQLNHSLGNVEKQINFNYNLQSIPILMDTAIPLGLLINELISNCYKYAWPHSSKGNINISLNYKDNGIIAFKLADDGIGFPEDFDLEKDKDLGLETVILLSRHQLNGNLTYINENGLTWILEFKDNLYKERV